MRLKESLEEILSEHQGQVAIFVKKLGSNETIRINETMVFPSASTIKLVIMATAMKEVKEGKRNLDDLIELKNYNKCGGDGILKELNFKHKFQLKEIITLMIILSDNTATNILIDMLGMDNINSVAESLGLKFTRLRRKMMDSEAVKQGKENTTNAEELSRILEMIYEGKLVDSQHSFIMLDILKRQQVGGRLNLYLPEDV